VTKSNSRLHNQVILFHARILGSIHQTQGLRTPKQIINQRYQTFPKLSGSIQLAIDDPRSIRSFD